MIDRSLAGISTSGGSGGGGGGGGAKITTPFPVILKNGKTFGKYLNGETVTPPPEGWTAAEMFKDMAQEYVPPVFSSFAISGQATTVEVGTTLSGSKTFTWGISLNSGIVPTVDILDLTPASTLLAATPNDGSQAVTIITKQLNAHEQTQSWRAKGNNTNGASIDSGVFSVVGRFMRYAGATGVLPVSNTDGTANRVYAEAFSNKAFQASGSNTFTLVTGTTYKIFVVFLPPTKTIVSVTDTSNLNADLTADYVLSAITIKDAGGTDRAYNMYTLTNGGAYASSANHVIKTN